MYQTLSFSRYSLPFVHPYLRQSTVMPPTLFAHICSSSYILEIYTLSMINTVFYGPTYYNARTVTYEVTQ